MLGAAFAAGLSTGVWDLKNLPSTNANEFLPTISEEVGQQQLEKWKKAIHKSFGWEK